MIDPAVVGARPPADVRKQRPPFFWQTAQRVVADRRIVFALTRRDFTARYKQTFLGVAWSVIVPFVTVVVFTLFVQRFAKIDTHGVPYPIWSYVGLLPWTLFSGAVQRGGTNMMGNRTLLNKIYATPAIYPIAGITLAVVDLVISVGALAVLFAIYRFPPSALAVLALPILALNLVLVVAAVLFVSLLTVYVRDVGNVVPIFLQLGLFATPVVYPLSQIPEQWRYAYCAANPLAPMIDGYRRVVLYGQMPDWPYLGAGALSTLVLAVLAFAVFSRFERGIVDIL